MRGTQRVSITAQEARYASGTIDLEVLDVQTIATVLNRNVLVENEATMRTALATVTLRSDAPVGGIRVNIEIQPQASVSVPSFVLIPEGQSTGTFPISLAEDNSKQGRRIVQVKTTLLGELAVTRQLILLDSFSDRWQNTKSSFDVDGDGALNPLDVLVVVNEINLNGARRLNSSHDVDRALAFVDVNDDGSLDPLDVLAIVNEINRRA